jgi:hypothetical protein
VLGELRLRTRAAKTSNGNSVVFVTLPHFLVGAKIPWNPPDNTQIYGLEAPVFDGRWKRGDFEEVTK